MGCPFWKMGDPLKIEIEAACISKPVPRWLYSPLVPLLILAKVAEPWHCRCSLGFLWILSKAKLGDLVFSRQWNIKASQIKLCVLAIRTCWVCELIAETLSLWGTVSEVHCGVTRGQEDKDDCWFMLIYVDMLAFVCFGWVSCLKLLGCCIDFCEGANGDWHMGVRPQCASVLQFHMPTRENQLQTFRSGDSGHDMWILNAFLKNELRWISGGKWHFEELTTQDPTAFEGPRFSVALCIGCCDPRCNEVDQSLWSWASVWFAVLWSCDRFDNKNATEAMPMGCNQKRPDPRGFGKLKIWRDLEGFCRMQKDSKGFWTDRSNAKLHMHHLAGHLLTPWSTTRCNRATPTRAYS